MAHSKPKDAAPRSRARLDPSSRSSPAAASPASAYRLSDAAIERKLARGEDRAALVEYFGEAQYEQLSALARSAAQRGVRGGPRVLILPGVMGSKLGYPRRLLDDVIWIDPFDVVTGQLRRLALGAPRRVQPLGVFQLAYLKLKLTLGAAGFDVDYHAYDWRRSVQALGAELKTRIEREAAASVSLVAHSMGGLLARAALHQGLAPDRLDRLVMLGTPNRGSFDPAKLVRGIDATLQKLAAFDLADSAEELVRDVFIDFPSVYELLPAPGAIGNIDLLQPDAWPRAGQQPNAALLQAAATLPSALAPADPDKFFLIAGFNHDTVTGLRVDGDEFVYESSLDGDGTVPLDLCLLPGARTYYIDESHGALPNNDAVEAAVCRILRGEVPALSDTRPVLRSAVRRLETDHELAARGAALQRETRGRKLTPRAARELLDRFAAPCAAAASASVNAEPVRPEPITLDHIVVGRRRQRRLDFELALGSVTEADAQATVLGIYQDVTPSGAAAAIDQRLNGAITEATQRRMLGGYTGEVFTLPTGRSGLKTEFVMFVGLGPVTGFSPQVLEIVAENALRTLIRSYVTDLATVLIGGASGGDLDAHLTAMMRGFTRALLDADGGRNFRRITLCEFDRAKFTTLRAAAFRLASTAVFEDVEVTFSERELPAAPAFASTPARAPDPVYLTVNLSQEPAATGGPKSKAKTSAGTTLRLRASVLGVGGKATVVVDEKDVRAADVRALLARIDGLSAAQAPRFGADLADLLLPADIRAALGGTPPDHPLVVINDRAASSLPWELLRIERDFVARSRGLHRRYLAEDLSVAKWLEARRRDSTLTLLLVIDPTDDLSGARREGERLLKLMSADANLRIEQRVGAQATRPRLLQDFSSGRFDVIHYAGHAYFDPIEPGRSGILCAGRQVLSGADLAGLRHLPSLVFFNACESGMLRTAGAGPSGQRKVEAPNRAAMLHTSVGLAESFLRGGVANYVGTYWPVGDAAAEAFAGTLYAALMKGQTMGAAIAAGRAQVAADSRGIDWADYIHYGDQTFKLKSV